MTKKNYHKIIVQARSVLLHSGLVIYPTETCYGIAALATDQKAINKLLAYKRRPEGKAISVAVNSQAMAEKYTELNVEA
ncbi:MAG TPA: Sua5/YciO/YrdC/YwlC family protein, partial [Candidatus Dojkabacteria bacterium]|nr:Sua5/YciO/YrdC/YwlC family protein [Candidatus Dojkabacteria bacterium]